MRSPRPTHAPGAPYATPDQAWLSTWTTLHLRRVGARGRGREVREGTADDVILAVQRLWRAGVLKDEHLRALRACGEAALDGGPPPCPQALAEALTALGRELAARGLVADAAPEMAAS